LTIATVGVKDSRKILRGKNGRSFGGGGAPCKGKKNRLTVYFEEKLTGCSAERRKKTRGRPFRSGEGHQSFWSKGRKG